MRWLIVTALLVAPLNLIFLLVEPAALVAIVYFLIYQCDQRHVVRAGCTYQAETFRLECRGRRSAPWAP